MQTYVSLQIQRCAEAHELDPVAYVRPEVPFEEVEHAIGLRLSDLVPALTTGERVGHPRS
jgi:hypothetical protein